MLKILGSRGAGKTTGLLLLAHKYGYTFVSPGESMADCARERAKELGIEVKIISFDEFLSRQRKGAGTEKYLIDELDLILRYFNVAGYSNEA